MTEPGIDLVVDAVLDDPGEPVPARGEQWTIAIMRYLVERVVDGEYEHPELYVGHGDLGALDRQLQSGARHRLQLSREFPAEAVYQSSWDLDERGVFYCLRFEPL